MFLGKIKKTICLFLFLALPSVPQSFGQDISVAATVNKNRLTMEDVLQLSIIIQGTQNTPPPKLPSLPDFRVVSAGTSSSTRYINTQRSVSITHNYRLTPMNTGTFFIGPARVQANGKTYSTQPIKITVQKSLSQETEGNKTAFVVANLSSEKAYVGEQLVYTFRLFHRVDAKNLNLHLPFDKTQFHKEELGKPKSYSKVINGLQYHVQELSLALVPLKKGRHKIAPARVELDLIRNTQNRSSRDDPFGQFFSRRTRVEHKVLRAQPLSIEVLPLPDGVPEGFENIVGQFNISAELGKHNLEVGDTATLTVTVSGKGNVQDVTFDEPDLESHFKIYPDKPEFHQTVHNNQVTGEKTFKFALVPLESGNKTLPEFSLTFFDPGKVQYRVVRTQPITLNVKPAATKESLNLVQSGQQNTPSRKPKIEILGKDIFPIYTELNKFQNDGNDSSPAFIGVGLGSPVILFILSALIIKRRRRMKYDAAFYRCQNAYKNATRCLKKMSTVEHSDLPAAKEFGRKLSEILREYVGNKLNLQGKAITAEEVEHRLKESGYESAAVTRKLLERCATLQFSPTTRDSTKGLLGESENLIKLLEKQS